MRVESNTFTLKQASLPIVVPAARADSPLRINHALPRNRCPVRQRVECVTHEACLPGQAGKARNLPVSGYASAWYPRHHIVNPTMQTFGCESLHWSAVTSEPANLSIPETVYEMIVHHADGLHVSIGNCGTDETKSPSISGSFSRTQVHRFVVGSVASSIGKRYAEPASGRNARTASIVSAPAALLSGRYPFTRAKSSVAPPG